MNPYDMNENNMNQNNENPNNIPNAQGGEPPRNAESDGWGPTPPRQTSNYGVPVGSPYVPHTPDSAYQQASGQQGAQMPQYGQQTPPNGPQYTGGPQQSPDSAYRAVEQTQQQYSTSSGWQNAPQERLPKKRRGVRIFVGSIACILAVAVIGFAGYGIYSLSSGVIAPQAPVSSSSEAQETPQNGGAPIEGINLADVPRTTTQVQPGERMSTEQIVEQVSPSVVAVLIYNNGYGGGPIGMGSGIVIREDGYIVTNAHVVENADALVVQQNNGETLEARIVGYDSQTDLAVIKVDATGLAAAQFGNSDQVKVGEKVIAIGNPRSMEFYGTVTQGIISGLNRQITAYDQTNGSSTDYMHLLQTDAAINEGNSGGALVNEYGQVIGINVAKSGGEGLGFAIPANDAKEIVDDLINVGYVTGRVRLGINSRGAVNQVEARNANLPYGIWVSSTDEGSDISKQGVLPGDIITKVDDTDITSLADVKSALEGKKPGDTVKLGVYRPPMANGSRKTGHFEVNVKVIEAVEESPQTKQEQAPATQAPSGQETVPNSPYGGQGIDPFEYFFGQFN